MLVVTSNDKSLRAPVRGLLASADAPEGFFVNINDRSGPMMVGDETIKIAGRSHVREKGISGAGRALAPPIFSCRPMRSSRPTSARRVNWSAWCSRASGQPHASSICIAAAACLRCRSRAGGAKVTAIEENRQAIDDLKANVRLNRLPADQIAPIAARVEDAHRARQPIDLGRGRARPAARGLRAAARWRRSSIASRLRESSMSHAIPRRWPRAADSAECALPHRPCGGRRHVPAHGPHRVGDDAQPR